MKYPIIIILFLAFLHEGQAQSPVASYNFFRDTVDISGNGNDLTRELGAMMGSALIETAYDSCRRYMSFDSSGYMKKENPSTNMDSQFTISFWMRSSDVNSDQKIVGQADLTDDSEGYVVGVQNNKVKAEVFGPTGFSPHALNSTTNIPSDTWVHIAVVYNKNSQFEIYINGSSDASDLTPPDWAPSVDTKHDLVVGSAPWNNNELPYTGDLDDLQIYNQALFASQIADIYNNVGLCPSGNNPIYVDSSATTGANNGLTWANAFTDLQEAIDLSCNCPDAEIWVAEGTYHPTQDNPASSDNTDRDVTFFIDHPVKTYGGFPSGGGGMNLRVGTIIQPYLLEPYL